MLFRLMKGEGAEAALAVALSDAIAAVVANGPGPMPLEQVASRVPSNPVPKGSVRPLRALRSAGG